MNSPSDNPLLDQIRDDVVREALEAPAAARPRNEWHEPVTWGFTGYVARVKLIECPSCQGWEWVSEGVFAEERGTNGTRRLTEAHQFPMNEANRRLETYRVLGSICFKCLSGMGFDNIVEAPEVITNIAGHGFTTPRAKTSLGFTRKGE